MQALMQAFLQAFLPSKMPTSTPTSTSPRALRWWPMLALWSCLLPIAASAAPESKAAALADARAWLSRIHSAANTGNYLGTMVFSAGGTISSSRVWHFAVGDQVYEQLEALDGRQQRILRHNDTVHTLWPQTRVAVLEKREAMAAWSTTPQEINPQALDQYELRREGEARIAGRAANVFLLEPRDGLRYAQRLWADQATGLMLRADVIGAVNPMTAANAVRRCWSPPRFLKLPSASNRSQKSSPMRCWTNARRPTTASCARSNCAPAWKPKVGSWPTRCPASNTPAVCVGAWTRRATTNPCCKRFFLTA
jgi:hypothetical protein